MLFTKHLTKSSSQSYSLFMTVIQTVLGFVCSVYDGKITLFSISEIPLVVIIGISGLLAHYCLTTALTLIPAAVVSPLEFVRYL